MIWPIVAYSVLGCIGMAIMDSVGTVLVKAINAGRGTLAGSMDAIGDAAKMSVLSVASVKLTSDYGVWGWVGVIPILITGFVVTKHSVHITKNMDDGEPTEEEVKRESKVLWLEQELLVLKAHHQARNTK